MISGSSQIAEGPAAQPVRIRHGSHAVVQSIVLRVIILALQAGTGILTARVLGPSGRGELAAMILWPLLVASVTTLGVPSSLIYYLRHRPQERRALIGNGFVMAILLGSAAAGLAALILPWWLRQYSPNVIHAAQWFLVTVPICSITLAGRAVLEASDEFAASNLIQILTPSATLVALLAFLFTHRLTAFTAALSYIAASLPTFAYMMVRVRRTGWTGLGWGSSILRLILSYGVRSYGVDLLGTLSLYVDQALVVSLLSASAMGTYVVVLSLSRMLNVFQNSVVMVLFPKAAGRSQQGVVELTGKSVRISGTVTAACGIAICVAGPTVLRILYGPEYVAAAGALRILVAEAVLSGATFVLAQAFMALGRPGIVTMLQGLGLALSVPLMLWLIPRMGIYGAAVSLLVSTTARLIFIYVGFRVFLKVNPPRLMPGREDARMIWNTAVTLRPERAA